MQKYYFCADVETTGTDRKIHDIWQISGAVLDSNLVVLERFDFKFRPFDPDSAASEALEKTRMTIEELKAFTLGAKEVHKGLIEIMDRYVDRYNKKDKFQFIAYNAQFDFEFLREFFIKNGDDFFGSWFWHPPICVMLGAAWEVVESRGSFMNFKLETLCRAAGLGWDENLAHSADYDIDQTIGLYKFLKNKQ